MRGKFSKYRDRKSRDGKKRIVAYVTRERTNFKRMLSDQLQKQVSYAGIFHWVARSLRDAVDITVWREVDKKIKGGNGR